MREEGVDCQLELLAVRPAHADDFISIHNFIEEVAEQTLMDQRRFVRIRYGALLREGMNPATAAEIARLADVIVFDSEGRRIPDRRMRQDIGSRLFRDDPSN